MFGTFQIVSLNEEQAKKLMSQLFGGMPEKQLKQPDKTYCIDVRLNEAGIWNRIEEIEGRSNKKSEAIVLNFIGELANQCDTFNGETIRYYESNNEPPDKITELNVSELTPAEAKAIATARQHVLKQPPEEATKEFR